MIVNLDEVKQLLNLSLTETSKDDVIESLIKPVQDFIVSYCNNSFENQEDYVAGLFQFVNSTDKIICPGESFSSVGFAKGMDVLVSGSINNDGIYEIKSISTGEIIVDLEDDEKIYDENAGRYITISRVKFPKALKRTAAKLISLDMNKSIGQGLKSESLGDYSASFGSDYPESLLRELNIYRCLRT